LGWKKRLTAEIYHRVFAWQAASSVGKDGDSVTDALLVAVTYSLNTSSRDLS